MHDQVDRNMHSSSLMATSPSRLLNLHQPKLARPVAQPNAAKKIKVNHVNGGVRPSTGGSEGAPAPVRSKFTCI